jgi:serine O-acetyltransferase
VIRLDGTNEPTMTDVNDATMDRALANGQETRSASGEVDLPRWNLDAIVAELKFSREVSHNIRPKGVLRQPPSREALANVLEDLSASLFPTHYGQSELGREHIDYFVGSTLNRALVSLVEQVHRSLLFAGDLRGHDQIYRQASEIVRDFAVELPSIRGLLVGDVRAAYKGDPAASNLYEILLRIPASPRSFITALPIRSIGLAPRWWPA